jgi:hypothetical protein
MVRDGLLIFNSIHKVMRAEGLLKDAGCLVKIMPVPRQLSSDCGLSIAFGLVYLEDVLAVLEREGCVPDETYEVVGGEYKKLK